jgi:gliding motility-associated-like protein
MKMRKTIVTCFVLVLFSELSGQIVLERQVIAATGAGNSSGDVNLEYTLGQMENATSVSNESILTQGFHQPLFNANPEAIIEIVYPSCIGENGPLITIQSITSCGQSDSVFWNGILGPTSYYAQEEVVILDIVTTGGCSISQNILVNISGDLPPCDLELYNTFTPNADGQNDLWLIGEITQTRFANNQITLLNRWGMEVRSFTNYDNVSVVWDGTDASGQELPQGVYYYVLEINDEITKGFVNLLK